MTALQLADTRRDRGSEVSLAIEGMTCGSCAARIEQRLNALDGVDARVNFATERARVQLSDAVMVDQVVAEVEAAGYGARVAPAWAGADHEREEANRRVRYLGRRLIVAGLLFMPLCDLAFAFSLVPSLRFEGWQWLLVALAAPVVTWCAWPFHKAALRESAPRHLHHGHPGVDGSGGGHRLVPLRHLLPSTAAEPGGRRRLQGEPSTSTWPLASRPSCWPGGSSKPGPSAGPATPYARWPRSAPRRCSILDD